MTALSKAALKALWVQFFQPTQADFANLIDSWTDYSPALEVLGTAVSGGSTGVPNVVSSTSVAFVALGATGSALMGAGTAASARTVIGVVSATETTLGIIEIATQAEANTGTDDTRGLTPAKLANISPASVTFDTSDQVLILDASDSNKLKRATVTTGKVIQQVYSSTAAYSSGTTTIPFDDTIPQNTEGTEFLTATITPTNSSNALMIEVQAVLSCNNAVRVIAALFQDSAANALSAAVWSNTGATSAVRTGTITLRYRMTAGTTSATTFRLRIGGDAASTIYFNGDNNTTARIFGGACVSSMTIAEIAP